MVTISNVLIIFRVSLIIIVLITSSIRDVKESEVYIIERRGEFHKMKDSGYIFLIPFIDKVKNVVNMEQQVINCFKHPVILENGKVIIAKTDIFYHITDPMKATYEVEHLSRSLEYLQITILRDIVGRIDNEDFKYLQKITKDKLKVSISTEAYRWGCVIDDVNIEFSEQYVKYEKSEIDELVSKYNGNREENIQENDDIKYRKSKLPIAFFILILFIILLQILRIVSFFLFREKTLANNVSYNLNNDSLELELTFKKGMVINEQKQDDSIGSMYVIKLDSGEEIELYNEAGLGYGKTYNICVYNYYKKQSHELISTEYSLSKDSDTVQISVQEIEYVYDYISKRIYQFNVLGNSYYNYGIDVYYKDRDNSSTLYNFIYDNENILRISNDFDVSYFIRNKYVSLEKIDTYESEYGNCYVLKTIDNEENIYYLMYIENKYKNNEKELDGIILYGYNTVNGYFENEKQAISSFKLIFRY